MNADRRKAMAYHEAGHAIVGAYLGFPIEIVTLRPDDTTLASVGFKWPMKPDHGISDGPQRVMFEDAAVTALAGPLAEERYLGHVHNPSAIGDYQDVFSYLQRFEMDEKVCTAWAAYLQERARSFIWRHWRAWKEIEAVANKLLECETLDQEAVEIARASASDDEEILRQINDEGKFDGEGLPLS